MDWQAWCQYLNQYWFISLTAYGITSHFKGEEFSKAVSNLFYCNMMPIYRVKVLNDNEGTGFYLIETLVCGNRLLVRQRYSQCWLKIPCIGHISYKNIAFIISNTRGLVTLFKNMPNNLRINVVCIYQIGQSESPHKFIQLCYFYCGLMPVGFTHTHSLAHWGYVMHICISKLTSIGPDNGHYLNQCWNIVNLNIRNKLQWNFKRNSYILIQDNGFENVVCEITTICLGLNVIRLCVCHCDDCHSASEIVLNNLGK